MADSWEDQADAEEEIVLKPKTPGLNPNAPTFTFNPNATPFSLTPGSAPPPPPPAAAPAAPAPAPPPPAPEPAAPPPPPPVAESKPEPPPAPPTDPPAEKLKEMSVKETAPAQPPAPKAASKPTPAEEEEDEPFVSAKDKADIEKMLSELEETREHMNIVFIGHVDAGKSTTGGQILLLTGNVDERTIQKYEKEAKEKNRESWYMAYIMDTNEEERLKGKTVEVGRAHFQTEKRRYTILDAPG